MTKKFLILLFFYLLRTTSYADVISDLENLKKVYSSLSEFSVAIEYNLYPTYTSLKPYSSDKGQFIKKGENDYLRIASVETYNTSKYRLVIDNESKTILIASPNLIKVIPMSFDIAVSSCEKILPIDFDKNVRGYLFHFKKDVKNEIVSITLLFNKKSYLLSRVVLFYKDVELNTEGVSNNPRVDIIYSAMSKKLEIAQNYFNIENFIFYGPNGPIAAKEYRDYTIFNTVK